MKGKANFFLICSFALFPTIDHSTLAIALFHSLQPLLLQTTRSLRPRPIPANHKLRALPFPRTSTSGCYITGLPSAIRVDAPTTRAAAFFFPPPSVFDLPRLCACHDSLFLFLSAPFSSHPTCAFALRKVVLNKTTPDLTCRGFLHRSWRPFALHPRARLIFSPAQRISCVTASWTSLAAINAFLAAGESALLHHLQTPKIIFVYFQEQTKI